ncbi:MAG: histidinol-phosphate transaminase [Acidobacteriia bacterium]|nr:histidinol-phosphate transaminase [Terriglobia bacterium]
MPLAPARYGFAGDHTGETPAPTSNALTTLIKLDSNENPFGPSPHAIKAMQAVLATCSDYPDDDASTLRLKLAEHHGVQVEQILVAGGLTEFLGMLARAFLAPGLNALTSQRSFIVYRLATEAAGAQLIEMPMLQDGFDLGGIAAAVNRNTRLIFLANPNNPTGTMVTADDIDHLLESIPEQVVVLDEAYYEFAQDFAARRGITYSRSLDYVRKGRNVVVLRTFSKVHGLAGARVGYGVASVDLIARISRQRSMYCVSILAQAGALAALEDSAHIRKAVENNTHESQRLYRALSEIGYAVTPTWGSFLYCDIGRGASNFAEQLRVEGIAIRPLDQWGAPEAVRITVGTPEQNDALLRAMTKLKNS